VRLSHYVQGEFIIWHLVDIVAKGGLMQVRRRGTGQSGDPMDKTLDKMAGSSP
jgi:hypothetical protein